MHFNIPCRCSLPLVGWLFSSLIFLASPGTKKPQHKKLLHRLRNISFCVDLWTFLQSFFPSFSLNLSLSTRNLVNSAADDSSSGVLPTPQRDGCTSLALQTPEFVSKGHTKRTHCVNLRDKSHFMKANKGPLESLTPFRIVHF